LRCLFSGCASKRIYSLADTLKHSDKPLHWALALALVGPLVQAAPAALPAQAAPAAPAAHAALLDTLRTGLANHPLIGVATAKARSQSHEVQRARGKHLPSLGVSTAPAQGGSAASYGAVASMNLWAFGAIQAQVNQQKAGFASARYAVAQACQEALVQTSDAYLAVLRADALVAAWSSHLKRYDETQAMVTQIAEVDKGRRIDVEQVLTRKGLVRMSLLDAQSQARQARLSLARAMGQALEPSDAALEGLVQALRPGSLQQAQDWSRAASPQWAAAVADVEAARYAADVSRGARYPQINLVWQNNRTRSANGRQSESSLGVQAQWTLFNGGSDSHAESASLQGVLAALARQDEMARVVEMEVAQAWDAAQTAAQRAGEQTNQERPALAVLGANQELFRLGRRTVLDILNAANDLHAIRTAQIESKLDAWQKNLRLHALTGRLQGELAVAAPHPCAVDAVTLPDSLLNHLPGF
jgi:outer membrane protein, adhesin transport system